MGIFVVLSFLACLIAWCQRNLSLFTKVLLSAIYAGSWMLVDRNMHAMVGIQVYCIYAVIALFIGQRVWLHFFGKKPVLETVDAKKP